MNPRNLFVLVAYLLYLLTSAKARVGRETGGWTPIQIMDRRVYEIAKFAVSEYNSKSKTSLSLEKVIKGETQIVSGVYYKLILTVEDGENSNRDDLYETVVWEKPNGTLQLISFVKVPLEKNNVSANVGTAVDDFGGWIPIENLKDSHVIEIAEFAVSEYNMQSKSNLKLEKVVKGDQKRVLSGFKYRLDVTVKNGTILFHQMIYEYEAQVVEQAWVPSMTLISFTTPSN